MCIYFEFFSSFLSNFISLQEMRRKKYCAKMYGFFCITLQRTFFLFKYVLLFIILQVQSFFSHALQLLSIKQVGILFKYFISSLVQNVNQKEQINKVYTIQIGCLCSVSWNFSVMAIVRLGNVCNAGTPQCAQLRGKEGQRCGLNCLKTL